MEVVSGADHRTLASELGKPAEEELSETPILLMCSKAGSTICCAAGIDFAAQPCVSGPCGVALLHARGWAGPLRSIAPGPALASVACRDDTAAGSAGPCGRP